MPGLSSMPSLSLQPPMQKHSKGRRPRQGGTHPGLPAPPPPKRTCTRPSRAPHLAVGLDEREDLQARGPAAQLCLESSKVSTQPLVSGEANTGLSSQGLQGRWCMLINDSEWECYLRHLPGALSGDLAPSFASRIKVNTRWEEPAGMPRRTAWVSSAPCKCVYGYGHFTINPQPYPEWMIELMVHTMPILGYPGQVGLARLL